MRSLPLRSLFRLAALAALPVLSSAAPVAGQNIFGRVLEDGTEEPVAGATVTLVNGRGLTAGRVVTDASGAFQLRLLGADNVSLRAERVGYVSARSAPLALSSDDSVGVELRLSRSAVVLAPLTVVASARPLVRDAQLAAFEWRREHMVSGRFLGPEEIRRVNAFYATDVLQQVPRVRVEGGFQRQVLLPQRMFTFSSGAYCVPNLYVDGFSVPLDSDISLDSYVTGSRVTAVEVYDHPASAPGEFPARRNPFCGVIVVWTGVMGARRG